MAGEFYCRAAVTGETVYAIQKKFGDLTVWNGSAFVTFVNANLATYVQALTETPAASYIYRGDYDAGLPAGTFVIEYYQQVGASPALEDALIGVETRIYDGTALVPPAVPGAGTGVILDYCVTEDTPCGSSIGGSNSLFRFSITAASGGAVPVIAGASLSLISVSTDTLISSPALTIDDNTTGELTERIASVAPVLSAGVYRYVCAVQIGSVTYGLTGYRFVSEGVPS